jgi:transposase
MRGKVDPQTALFFSINLEDRIRPDHPLRRIKRTVDAILHEMAPLFESAYSNTGRPSVPPERLLKASLLQCLYSVRSETQLVERLDTDLLFRWFCDMDPAEPVFDPTAFTHNRKRLEDSGIAATFFELVVKRAIDAGLTSDDHFSVDGTLIESYASLKSFRPKDNDQDDPGDGNGFKPRNAAVDFHGQKRSNATHRSTTDGEALLYRKGNGQPALLYHMGHAVTENRHGLIMAVAVTEASGTAEPAAAEAMVDDLRDRFGIRVGTLGADKNYDSGPHLLELERRGVTPHVAMRTGPVGGEKQTTHRWRRNRAGIAARQRMASRLGDAAYAVSQRCRKLAEEGFGWLKTVAGMVRTRLVGRWKIRQQMHLAAAAYNLVRMRKLLAT